MRYELAWPLLFANLLRWISPEIFLRSEVGGASVGTVKLQVEDGHRRQGREGHHRRRLARALHFAR
jgi:hypothetical protein